MSQTSLAAPETPTPDAEIGAILLRYASGGGVCFAVNLGLLWLATEVWKWHYLVAMAASWLVVSTLGFFLHRRWTFRSSSTHIAGEAKRYITVNLAQVGCATGLMVILVSGLHMVPWIANVLAAIILLFASFLLHRNWSFRTESKPKIAAPLKRNFLRFENRDHAELRWQRTARKKQRSVLTFRRAPHNK